MKTLQTLLKITLATIIGVLTGFALGKNVSDAPLALALWACIGGFVAFVLAGSKQFARELVIGYSTLRSKYEQKKSVWDQKIEEKRREKERQVEHRHLFKKVSRFYWLSATFVAVTNVASGVWLSFVVRFFDSTFSFLYFWLVVCIIVGLFNGMILYFKIQFILDRRVTEVTALEELWSKKCREERSVMIYFLIGPLWLLIGVWWCLRHPMFLLCSAAIILAKIYVKVSCLERWCAAIGAVVGFVVGWSNGRSEVIAMIVGALVGNGVYVITKHLPKILPDPNSPWPRFA